MPAEFGGLLVLLPASALVAGALVPPTLIAIFVAGAFVAAVVTLVLPAIFVVATVFVAPPWALVFAAALVAAFVRATESASSRSFKRFWAAVICSASGKGLPSSLPHDLPSFAVHTPTLPLKSAAMIRSLLWLKTARKGSCGTASMLFSFPPFESQTMIELSRPQLTSFPS